MIDLKQKQLMDWQNENFGQSDDNTLKGSQHIREGVNGIDTIEVADGVADVLIFGIQLLSSLGINAEHEISETIDKVLKRDWKRNPNNGKGIQIMEFNKSGSKYLREIITTENSKVDIYAVLDAFQVTCPARQHAIKKLLCTGLRGKGSVYQDLKEAGDAVTRAIQMEGDRNAKV